MQTLLLALTLIAQAAAPTPAPASDITEPANAKIALTATGKGYQVYACTQQGVAYEWVLKAPKADLFDATGTKLGTHSAGPTWTALDGSSITGKVLEKKISPEPASVAWLLLAATPAADHPGTFANIAFVRRSDTHGGQPPPDGCDAAHPTATTQVPYVATYTFYTAGK